MSLEETKVLLRTHRITPNKLMGQNFLVDTAVYPKLAQAAALNREDVVLDVGAGFGFLTLFLANKCKCVVAVEKDRQIAAVLQEQVKGLGNIVVVEGDALKVELPSFNKVVAAPPYYLSSDLVMWLLERGFDCAVLIVQKEFANRLLSPVGSEEYSWLTVVANLKAEAKLLDEVPKWMFYPEPEVDSVILQLTPCSEPSVTVNNLALVKRLTKWLFTQRNKKLANALVPFVRTERKLDKAQAEAVVRGLPFLERRARELSPTDFGVLSDALCE